MKNNLKKIKKPLAAVISVIFWIAVWQILSAAVGSELLLPSPITVVRRLFVLGSTPVFWETALFSIIRIAAGFVLGVIAGTIFAVASAASSHIDALISPLGAVIRATPVASFIILALVWIKASDVPTFISFLMVTPIIWGSLKASVLSTDKQLLEAAKSYRLGIFMTLKAVYLPHIMPQYTAAVITSLGLAWKAGIAAEVLCRPKNAIGTMLYDSKIYLETADLFAWTVTVIILSIIMEFIFKKLLNRHVGEKND